jgi:hypothetical protein
MVTKKQVRSRDANQAKKARVPKDLSPRFGIGEWFGKSVNLMTGEERRALAKEVLKPKAEREPQPCPFRGTKDAKCSKEGGVCSLRLYSHGTHEATGRAIGIPVAGPQGELRATCPYRFHEANIVFNWVGQVILGDTAPHLVGEVGFLESGATTDAEGGDDVGRIDMVLVSSKNSATSRIEWGALEIQAVYFSGSAMLAEFKAYADDSCDWVIFPAAKRRPDYRSSGPKRLMPQLQIKVPTLRRWGRKMAVVVDQSFFDSIGEMDDVQHISNSDIAWFTVGYEEVANSKQMRLTIKNIRYTTLERAVEGLTGGKPVALPVFEERIRTKVNYPVATLPVEATVTPQGDTSESDSEDIGETMSLFIDV